jgi:hypothetical protein
MENINGKSRASFRWMLSFATIGLVASISPCFAQGNRDASQEMQRLGTAPPEMMTPFKCDSLDPKVCFEIYRRRVEQRPEGTLYNEYPLGKALAGHRFDSPFDPPKEWNTAIDVRGKTKGLPFTIPKDATRIK